MAYGGTVRIDATWRAKCASRKQSGDCFSLQKSTTFDHLRDQRTVQVHSFHFYMREIIWSTFRLRLNTPDLRQMYFCQQVGKPGFPARLNRHVCDPARELTLVRLNRHMVRSTVKWPTFSGLQERRFQNHVATFLQKTPYLGGFVPRLFFYCWIGKKLELEK